jgi:hypothetical protein
MRGRSFSVLPSLFVELRRTSHAARFRWSTIYHCPWTRETVCGIAAPTVFLQRSPPLQGGKRCRSAAPCGRSRLGPL